MNSLILVVSVVQSSLCSFLIQMLLISQNLSRMLWMSSWQEERHYLHREDHVPVANRVSNSIAILHLSNCWVSLRPAVFTAARILPSVSRHLEISFGLWEPSSRLLPPSGGVLPDTWGAPNKGNADEAVGIFGNARRVWAPALRPDPPKKSLVPHSSGGVTDDKYRKPSFDLA